MSTEMRNHKNGDVLRARGHVSGRDFTTVFRYVLRRKWVPVLGLVAGVGIGFAAMVLTPPLYSASARIMISNTEDYAGTLRSEVEIIESTPVLSKVAGVLGLYRDPRFKNESILERLAPQTNEENALRERVLTRLSRMLHVQQIDGTSIIDMTVRHPNPDRAAQIANVVLSSYRERKVDDRFEQTRELGAWMAKHLETIKAQAEDSKKRLEAFQAEHGLIALGGTDIKAQRIQSINQEMADTHGDIAMMQTRLDQLNKTGRDIGAPRSDAARAEVRRLENGLADLLQRYGDKHPKVIAQKRAVANARAGVPHRSSNPTKDITADIEVAQSKLEALQKQMDEIASGYDADGRLSLQQAALQSEVDANDRLYENLLVKYQDLMAQTELQDTGMKVVSMATIPSRPDQVARIATVMALGAIGFLLGLSVVMIRALCLSGFNGTAQLESMTGYPVFAAIPNAAQKGTAIHHTIIDNPAAILAESLRSLRVALRLRRGHTGEMMARGPRVVAFTSTLPNEGKTSLAVMLAVIAAKSGERVVIVDCDLRRPSLHKTFGIGNARGLQDYLANASGLDDVIYRKDPSGVHLVTTKAVPSYSLTLLTSGRMEHLIEGLRERYDLVILDAPSSLAFADARVLARMVDQTLYVVAWNRTRREGALASLKAYADMGYEDLALVLNKVDLREFLRDSASAVIYQYGRDDEDSDDIRRAA